MVLGGLMSPFAAFDMSAANNSKKDFMGDMARAHAEYKNSQPIDGADDGNAEFRQAEAHNARMSGLIGGLEAVRTTTATPLGHVVSHAISHAATGVGAIPVGDAAWYGAASAQDKLQKRKVKVKTD